MINFTIGGENGFKVECADNEAAEKIIAYAVSIGAVVITATSAYAIANKASEYLLENSSSVFNNFSK
ncbi:hypothetical protein Dd586_0738 [Dickeya parazeae Ech586]|uniref:Uncharacterized protein n=1 Tax=Dickeya zeae (strain Ech586) TaxID=590409 RepID=D2BSK9_DICZ5|nr:hypothetical protein [Dickeya parazeae]ACZ75628.1 hypothetical protein Dd586_0738 [Dickeya parazeae Ech586]